MSMAAQSISKPLTRSCQTARISRPSSRSRGQIDAAIYGQVGSLLVSELAQGLARDRVKPVELGAVVLAPAPDRGRGPDLLGRHALHRLPWCRAADEVEQLQDRRRGIGADVLVAHAQVVGAELALPVARRGQVHPGPEGNRAQRLGRLI